MSTVTDVSDAERAAAIVAARLVALQRPGGAWAAGASGPDAVEPTALAALALAHTGGDRERVARATRWLAATQRADGSWPATVQVDAPSWAGGAALLALARLGAERDAVARGAAWLLDREGAGPSWLDRQRARVQRWRGVQEVVTMDWSLRGWPWIDGTFSWVEPTSVAVLALRAAAARVPVIARDDRLAARVDMGRRMLVDRAVPGGGWNYGNSRVFDTDLPPYPDTTGWGLLALRGFPPARASVDGALRRLPALLDEARSSLARSLAALALRAHGRDDAAVRGALAARLLDAGPPAEVRTQALALLALAGPPLPFEP